MVNIKRRGIELEPTIEEEYIGKGRRGTVIVVT